jgi:RNA polymerase sigma-70 factor (ECF subfamily)
LATSVVNRVRDRIRKDRRRAGWLNSPPSASAEPARPDHAAIYDEEALQLNSAMAELPYDQREVIVLKLTNDMRFKEIAKIQGAPIGTVQARYRYGLNKLRATLNGEVDK